MVNTQSCLSGRMPTGGLKASRTRMRNRRQSARYVRRIVILLSDLRARYCERIVERLSRSSLSRVKTDRIFRDPLSSAEGRRALRPLQKCTLSSFTPETAAGAILQLKDQVVTVLS